MQEPIEWGVGVLRRVRVVRHGHDHLRLELVDDLGRLRGGQVDLAPRDGDQNDVDVAQTFEVGGRQLMSQVPQVAYHEVVQPDREDRVPATRGALGIVVERTDTRHEDLVDLVFAGSPEHDGVAANRFQAGVAGVVVGDGDDGRLGLGDGVSGLRVRGVGQDDALAPAHTKTSVAQPGQVHGTGREYAK